MNREEFPYLVCAIIFVFALLMVGYYSQSAPEPMPTPLPSPTPTTTYHLTLYPPLGDFATREDPRESDVDWVRRTLAFEVNLPKGDWTDRDIMETLALGWVIRTRVEMSGRSYEEVVKDPYQFTCWNDKGCGPALLARRDVCVDSNPSPPAYCDTLNILSIMIVYGWAVNPYPGATHYYDVCILRDTPPSWADQSKYLGALNCHRFYGLGYE
jgi:hypothetical protein